MKLKDFVIITLLAVVSFVLSMAGGAVQSLFGTYGVFVNVAVGSLLSAPIYFVMCNKVHKRGTIFAYYIIVGLAYTLMGFMPMILILLVVGLVGEGIVFKAEYYKNNKVITVSYIVSQLVYALHGFLFILCLGVSGLANTFPNLFTVEQAQAVHDIFFNVKNITIILVVQLIVSYIGTMFGRYINKKFFSADHAAKGILE